ncbi:MAG: TonB family protein, partial [Acidobacteriota bacterium]|nr:TonB family protein [Acidobacteriota bacterium]
SVRRVILQSAMAAAICASMATNPRAGEQSDSTKEFLRAAESTDIRAPGSPPFELDAKVDISGNNGKLISGTYKLVWVSPSQWREVLTFPGYSRLRVGGEERYWQTRTIDYEPLQITELSAALDFASSLRNEKPPWKLKTRKESGQVVDCAENGEGFNKKEYCFSQSDGVLLFKQEPEPPEPPFVFTYSDFSKFGAKEYPGKIEVTIDKALFADLSVERLVAVADAASLDFAPPSGASLWLTCPSPDKARLVNQVRPVYPAQEKFAHHEGVVTIYGIIAPDGSLENLEVLAAPSSAFAEAALAAVRQWRYEPRRCDGIATPTEIVIHVVFTLGRTE